MVGVPHRKPVKWIGMVAMVYFREVSYFIFYFVDLSITTALATSEVLRDEPSF